MGQSVARHRVAATACRQRASGREAGLGSAWEALAHARECLSVGDVHSAAGSVELAVCAATQALLLARKLPAVNLVDIGTCCAVCEIVLGSQAGRLAQSACAMVGLTRYPGELLSARDLTGARDALNSSAALVALIECEVCR